MGLTRTKDTKGPHTTERYGSLEMGDYFGLKPLFPTLICSVLGVPRHLLSRDQFFISQPSPPTNHMGPGALKWRVIAAEFRERMCNLSFEMQQVWTLSNSQSLLTESIIATVVGDILC